MKRNAILLINIGTPNKPEIKAVRRYLSQFLNDRRVIDLPFLLRKILVNLIIVPFRARKSTNLYKQLWTPEGSPLLTNMLGLQKKLQAKTIETEDVFVAMRYQNPSIKKALKEINSKRYDKLTIIPLFPHYASSTSGTAIEAVMKIIKRWDVIPEIRIINQFYEHPAFIRSLTQKIKSFKPENYDHIIFSYHGLPDRHLNKTHPEIASSDCNCEKEMPVHGKLCYKATCFQTTRLLANKLELKNGTYTTSFQSRLSKNWMTPFTDAILKQLAISGEKSVLIAAPSFVSDCLETTVEIKHEYKNKFISFGGEELTLVESLNNSDEWIETLRQLI
ncbi:MAG: ferrochelatase [Prolixibacteraceae bacterium]|jgi:ferrochelatase|nr:ferrochelatase [Prolixibacteraceae bacterium]